MKRNLSLILYFILAALMLLDFYLIFNVGNPDSLFRFILKNSNYDIVATLVVSCGIAFLAFYVFKQKQEAPVVSLLKQNKSHIDELRKNGQSISQIAESFILEVKPNPLIARKVRKLVFETLEEMEK
jgi:hypothetical protein